MKNFLLSFKLFYRLYQKVIRIKKNEYEFINHIFRQTKNAKVLDLCCGDSFVLNYINENIQNYTGIDNNENYLKDSRTKYSNYKFINSDIENINKILELNNDDVNFIFLNGAIHHLDNGIVENLINALEERYPDAIFLTIDPVKDNNKLLNRIMIYFDRGEHIRDKNEYKKLMKNFNSLTTDDFFIMSFKLIFHFKNLDLEEIYLNWKNN